MRARIATLITLLGLGGLAAAAVTTRGPASKPAPQAAVAPTLEVRTEVIRRTVYRTRHERAAESLAPPPAPVTRRVVFTRRAPFYARASSPSRARQTPRAAPPSAPAHREGGGSGQGSLEAQKARLDRAKEGASDSQQQALDRQKQALDDRAERAGGQ